MWNILSDRSNLWSIVRKEHLKKEPHCMACGTLKKPQVHHIEPFHINPSRELDPTNLITLCHNCHFVFGHLMDYNSWNINVQDDCKVYYLKVQHRPYKIITQNVKISSNIFIALFRWINMLFRNN